MDNIEKLKQLKQLLDEGILTQEEFDTRKEQLLFPKKAEERKRKAEEEKRRAEEEKRLAEQKAEEEKRLARLKEEKEKLAKQKAEEERLAKQKAEEERIAKQKAEAERLAKQKAEEERLAKLKAEEERLAKQKAEEEKRLAKLREEEEKRKEQIKNSLREKKKYEEALSYMEYADQADNKSVAAEFYRKAEVLFEQVVGWEDAEDKSLLCARKAKLCEIEVESLKIAEKKKEEEKQPDTRIPETAADMQTNEKEEPDITAGKESDGNKKSKGLIVAAIIGLLVIGGVVFAMTQGKTSSSTQTDNSSETSESSTSESSSNGESYAGDLIPAEDPIEIKWDNGSAVLTNYQIEKSQYDGDCVNLYFDYTKTGGEDDSFSSALDVGVFQNGYELDEKTSLTTDAEENAYNQLKNGATTTAARGFVLNDASELTVVLTAYDKDYNSIIERTKLTIPEENAEKITGNKKYFEDTGETKVEDGVSLKSKDGEVVLTGYKWNEYEGEEMLTLYFDYTNLRENESSMTESNINVTVFQNGVEQEGSGWSTSEAESHYFSRVQNGTTMHCGYSFSVKDKSDIDVKLTYYGDDGEINEEKTISIK